RTAEVPERRFRLREPVECERIGGKRRESDAHVVLCRSNAPGRELEQPELDARPGIRLTLTDGRRRGELHRMRRPGDVADQLTGVRHTRVRRDTGLQPRHTVERGERSRIVTELDL